MGITRREALIGLAGLAAAVEVSGAPAEGKAIMGPTVFHWNDAEFKPNEHGAARQLCRQPTATLDQLEMHQSKLNPGQSSHAPHRHVNEELIILREGQCETLSDGKWVKVGPGDIVFNASNSLHAFRNVGTTQAVYHVINWSPNKG